MRSKIMRRKVVIYVFLLLIAIGLGLIYYFNQEHNILTVKEFGSPFRETTISKNKELKTLLDKSKSKTPLIIKNDIYGGVFFIISEETTYGKISYVLFSDKLYVIDSNKDNKILSDKWYPLKKEEFIKIKEIIELHMD